MEDKELIAAIHQLELSVTTELTRHTTQLKNQCDKLDVLFAKVDQNQKALFGMGEEKGLVTKLSTLEETEENHKYTLRALFTMIVAIIGKILYDIFRA